MTLRVNPEDLVSSAAHVTGQGEDLAAGHLSSDSRIAAAQGGWIGASAAALSVKLAEWAQTSTALVSRVGDHAQGLNNAAITYTATEADRAEALHRVGEAADSIAPRG